MTTFKPDICVLSESEKKLYIIELTVPFEPNIPKSHQYKVDKYTPLANDVRENGYEPILLALEIGSRGYISKDNNKILRTIHKSMRLDIPFPNLL